VASIDNRNWELGDHVAVIRKLSQSLAMALDMESAAIAANGFGSLRRASLRLGQATAWRDKARGDGKPILPKARRATSGDRSQALENLKTQERERLHSRKLRSLTEVAFQ
jgi:AMP nucleosidase